MTEPRFVYDDVYDGRERANVGPAPPGRYVPTGDNRPPLDGEYFISATGGIAPGKVAIATRDFDESRKIVVPEPAPPPPVEGMLR